jgi:hypothetical protein
MREGDVGIYPPYFIVCDKSVREKLRDMSPLDDYFSGEGQSDKFPVIIFA